MTWRPSTAQLCTIAELRHARAPVETIARELHITAEDFIAWRKECMAAVAAGESAILHNRPEPVPRREPPERHARMTVARLFEMPAPNNDIAPEEGIYETPPRFRILCVRRSGFDSGPI